MTIQKFTIHANINNEDVVLHPKTEVAQVEGFSETVDDQIDAKVYPITNQEIRNKWEILDPDTDLPLYITAREAEVKIENYVPQAVRDIVSVEYILNCLTIENLDASGIDVGRKNKLSNIFPSSLFPNLKTIDVSTWDTDNVIDMSYVFAEASGLTTLNVSDWNTENVTDMNHAFYNCRSLTSLDLSDWNTRKVANMNNMFANCKNLTALNLSSWDTGEVTDMHSMFYDTVTLSSVDISEFNTIKVTDVSNMFCGNTALTSIDMSGWNTANIISMSYMFYGCTSLTAVDISGWISDLSIDKRGMFAGCTNLKYIVINSPDVLFSFKETDMLPDNPFVILVPRISIPAYKQASGWNKINAASFKAIEDYTITKTNGQIVVESPLVNIKDYAANNITNYTTVTEIPQAILENLSYIKPASDASGAFKNMSHLSTVGNNILSTWNMDSVVTISSMFKNCTALSGNIALPNWNVANVTSLEETFSGCAALNILNISQWNVGSVENCSGTFKDCYSLLSLDLSEWNLNACTDMSNMFSGCSNLRVLDISKFDTRTVIANMSNMFTGLSSLQYIILNAPILKFIMQDYEDGGLINLAADFKILVPSSLLNTYRNATNWSVIASKFDAIENYTIHHDPDGISVEPIY